MEVEGRKTYVPDIHGAPTIDTGVPSPLLKMGLGREAGLYSQLDELPFIPIGSRKRT